MGLRSLVAQYFGGPMGAQMVASHDEKYADTGAENPYLEKIINQSNHSGVTKWGSAAMGGGEGGDGVSDLGMSTGSVLGDKAINAGKGGAMSKMGGGAKGSANHKDMFNQPTDEGDNPAWSNAAASSDFLKQQGDNGAGGDSNDVNPFKSKYANQALNAALPDSWKATIAPYTPQNLLGTAIKGAKGLFSSGSGASAETDDGDIDLD